MSKSRTSNEAPARQAAPPVLLVISAPSGAGKLSILRAVRKRLPELATTVSATTRPPREGEVDGVDYHFLAPESFARLVEEDAFLEWAEVHGNRYGTLKSELDRRVAAGVDTVIELDVQGMRSLRAIRDDVPTVFLMPPSLEELERRLRHRGANSEEDIALRLDNAREEMAARHEFDYIIVNDDLDHAAGDLLAIIRAERCRAFRQP